MAKLNQRQLDEIVAGLNRTIFAMEFHQRDHGLFDINIDLNNPVHVNVDDYPLKYYSTYDDYLNFT